MELGLNVETEISGELSPIDITRGWEVSGRPMSYTWLSHLRGSGLTPGQSTKTLSAPQLRRKGRKEKTKKETKNK